jgi:hypothetical protein
MKKLGIDSDAVQDKMEALAEECAGDMFMALQLDRQGFTQIGYYPGLFLDRQPVRVVGYSDPLQE